MLEHVPFLAVLVVLALGAVRARLQPSPHNSPQERYARGEIDETELERRRPMTKLAILIHPRLKSGAHTVTDVFDHGFPGVPNSS